MSRHNNQPPQVTFRPGGRLRFLGLIERHIQGRTIGGLMELVPLLVTAIVLLFIVRYADAFIRPLQIVAGRPWDFPGIGIIATVVVFYLIGLLSATGPGRHAMDGKDWLLNRIPGDQNHLRIDAAGHVLPQRAISGHRVVFIQLAPRRNGRVGLPHRSSRVRQC